MHSGSGLADFTPGWPCLLHSNMPLMLGCGLCRGEHVRHHTDATRGLITKCVCSTVHGSGEKGKNTNKKEYIYAHLLISGAFH